MTGLGKHNFHERRRVADAYVSALCKVTACSEALVLSHHLKWVLLSRDTVRNVQLLDHYVILL